MPLLLSLGLLTGAGLNLCADQFTHGIGLHRQPMCPYCRRPRPWWAWVSLLAFLTFRIKCQGCGAPISWRHPLLELATVVLFWLAWLRNGAGPLLVLDAAYGSILLLVAVVDLEVRRIPKQIVYPAAGLALIGGLIHPTPGFWRSSLFGGVAGWALLYLAYLLGKLVVLAIGRARGEPFNAQAFGRGDVRLGALVGLILGLPGVLTALVIAVLIGAAASLLWIIGLLLVRGRYSPFTSVAYGPFLVAGALLTLLLHLQFSPAWLPR